MPTGLGVQRGTPTLQVTNRGGVSHAGVSPRAPRGARLSTLPSQSEHWLGTRQQEAPRGPRPRTTVATAAQGWRGEALQVPTLSQGCSCCRVERLGWGAGLGPVRICGPAGRRAEWAGAVGVLGAWPSCPSLQLSEASTTTALFTGGHGPSGRVCYRRAGAAGRQSSRPQRTQQAAFVGGLTRPRKERRMGYFLPLSLAFPPWGGGAAPSMSPGKQPGPVPPQGTSMGVRLMSEPQVCPEVKKVGGSQKGVMSLPQGSCSHEAPVALRTCG